MSYPVRTKDRHAGTYDPFGVDRPALASAVRWLATGM